MHAPASRPSPAPESSGESLRLKHYRTLAEQLQRALDRRVPIEQAKGILAERHRISVDEAFGLLRAYCRNNNLKIGDVARALVERPGAGAPQLLRERAHRAARR
ncbi:MAG TPA: ANTAR domain-containing protein [Amycolatopsis sp.]|nr:ANTAR domain-containing protein [Amycolatopsis sp.]